MTAPDDDEGPGLLLSREFWLLGSVCVLCWAAVFFIGGLAS